MSQPHPHDLLRRLVAEGLGSLLLLAIVIGSGIMGERLAGGNAAIALLGNTLATGAGLVVLITVFGPVSGAHFNPAVSLVFALRREIKPRTALAYALAQTIGAVLGVWLAHAMFGEAIWQVSTKLRNGPGEALAEFVATFGLVATILGCLRFRPDFTAVAVGLYITAAYWFTASTSFANPAVTLARTLSDTFAGIAPASAPAFILAQVAGAAVAALFFQWLFSKDDAVTDTDFPVVIYHNPDCGTSRNVVGIAQAAGYAPVVVPYLECGWQRDQLQTLMAEAGAAPRDFLREKGTPAAELGLLDPAASDEAILAAMIAHPILVNRPIVVTPKGVKLCRPSEAVFELLERRPTGFVKEDGEVVTAQAEPTAS